ncbi:MAG: ribosome biogenesis GTP-binding protein YihA/YsxC [Alphaproteobacteria bacterium]|jgi:GTP-binding protein|nr:ribosome biogenesis GTP-binding protein YihA/YsxC [Alphaproteobacteria bacterium]
MDSQEVLKKDLSFFRKQCNFVLGVAHLKQLPQTGLPEVAFWGRSNVGKSSLINALLNRKKLVKVSQHPGKTKEINYFSLNEELYFVDLPGYGYAKVSHSVKDLWNDLVVEYLQKAKNLRRIFLLIDAKVGFKEIDFHIMDFLDYYGRSYQIVLTKTDKINKFVLNEVSQSVVKTIETRPACYPEFILSSSQTKEGMESLQLAILNIL